jgi:hypothetical protein
MADVPDIGWIALGIAVVAAFAWFFWHTARSMLRNARALTDYLDSRSMRLRQRLDYEAMHGRAPLWYRLAQKLAILTLVAAVAALAWTKFRGA